MSQFTFEIAVDDNASNPRHPFKTFTTLVFSPAARKANPSLRGDCWASDDELAELMNDEDIFIVPVHTVYDGDRVILSCEEGGVDGVIYAEKSKIKAHFGDLTAETYRKVWCQFLAELHEFQAYANDEVYAYVVRDSHDLPVASAGGYCSRELAIQGAKDKILEMRPRAA